MFFILSLPKNLVFCLWLFGCCGTAYRVPSTRAPRIGAAVTQSGMAATLFVRTKTDMKTVQALLRHVRTTLQLYAHCVTKDPHAVTRDIALRSTRVHVLSRR